MMLDLDAIQALADAATPGPWEWSSGGGPRVRIPGVRDLCRWHEFDSPTVADSQFIAFSREWVPALVAELRAAREVIVEAQTQGHGPDTDNPNCVQCKAVTAYLKVAGAVG